MKGRVNDRALATLEPCDPATLAVGDIVLVRVAGRDYVRLIKAIDRGRFLIGNNRGGINGCIGAHDIYGMATGRYPPSPPQGMASRPDNVGLRRA